MINLQQLSSYDSLDANQDQQQNTKSSLATMQADMDIALQKKQQAKQKNNIDHSISIDSDAGILSVIEASVIDSSTIDSSTRKSDELLSKKENVADNIALNVADISRVIEMAWEDRTPFAAIEHSYGLTEADVIIVMRRELKPSSFRLWRQRVTGRSTKHQAKRSFLVGRAHCATQYKQR